MKKIIFIVCVALCLSLCGCSKKVTPTSVVDTYIKETKKQINSGDLSSIYSEGEESSEEITSSMDEELQKELISCFGSFEYTINSETIDGDKATVNVTFKAYDFGMWIINGLTEYFQKALALAFTGATDEQMDAIINEVFAEEFEKIKEKGKTKETNVDLVVSKEDGQWVFDEEANAVNLGDGATGGMISAILSMSENLSALGE